jgi:hypothetical protein
MRPTLVTNPADDEVFAAFAAMLTDHGVDGIDDFEQRLRCAYPHATVHPRLLSGEARLVWYVYREGRWVSALEREKSGLDPGDPRVDDISARVEHVIGGMHVKAAAERELAAEIGPTD